MKTILLILMVLASVAHAQLGWTLEQCQKHYGPNKEKRWIGKNYVTEFRAPIHGLLMYLEIFFNEKDTAYEISYSTATPGRLPSAVVNAILKDNASRFMQAKEELNFANDDKNLYDSLTLSAFGEL